MSGVCGGERGFAVWNTDGRIEIFDLDGVVIKQLSSGVQAVGEVTQTTGGWLVRGSSFADGTEQGAIALVDNDGEVRQRWTTSGMFWSVASKRDSRVASDHLGQVFSLAQGLEPMAASTRSTQPLTLRYFGDELVPCTTGSRRLGGVAEGTCRRASGAQVEGIWRTPPIACGPWLIADLHNDATTDSSTTRVVWAMDTNKLVTREQVVGPAGALGCTDHSGLVDLTPPGSMIKLPGLKRDDEPLCPSTGTQALAVAQSRALCVDSEGAVSIHMVAESTH